MTVTDNLPPAAVVFVSATPSTGSCTQAALVVSCTLGAMTASETRTITVLVNVNSNPGTLTTLTNTAAVSGGATPDPNTANNSATATTAIIRSADLSVTKVDIPDPVAPGTNLTYTVTASNAGPSAQGPVTLTDILPPGVTFVSVNSDFGSCSQAAGTVTCGLGTMVNGRVATITIVIGIPAAFGNQTITNSATIAPGGSSDPVPGNNTASASTTVTRQADLQITKTDAPDPVIAGQQLTYTLTGHNNGPSNASAVTISDPLPPGTTFVSASAGCTNASGTVTCTIGDLALNASVTRTITVTVPPATAAGATLTNTATISSAAADVVPGNNSATAATTVNRSADLSITKTDTPDPVVAGTAVTYSLNVANAGPSDAAAVTVTDPLPAGTAFLSGTAGCTTAGNTVTCTIGALAAGATTPVTLVVSVLPSVAVGTTLTNTATVGSSTTDPTPGNNSATATTAVTSTADVSITKTDAPDPVIAGSQLTYTLNVTNAGPSDATGVVVTDPLPANTLFLSASAGCAEASGTVTCTIGTLAAATSTPRTIVVGVLPNVATGTTLTNTATVTLSTPDPTPGNNTATTTTTVNASADLSITKTDTPDPANAGQSVTYTLTIANNGVSNATGITVTDTLPPGIITGPAPAGCNLAATTLTCTIASLAPSSSATINYTVGIAPETRGVLTNTAVVAATTPDPNPANNRATSTTTVNAPADVSITKTDTPDPVAAGTQLTYTLTAANVGPARANNVVVTDVLPVGTTFVSVSTGCTNTAGTISCAIGVLDPGSTATVTVTVAVPAATPAGTTITNTATIAATESDPTPANNSASVTTTVSASADLSITKTDAPDPVNAGGQLTYTLAVANVGAVRRGERRRHRPAPRGHDVRGPASPGCTNTSGTVACNVGTLAAGATTTRSITVAVLPTVPDGTVLTNTATVAAATPDPTPANNSASATTTVSTSADLTMTKTDAPDPVTAGTQLTYTLTVTNNGPSDAIGVTITDPLSAGTTFASAAPGCTNASGTVTCTVGPLAAGATATRAITVTVQPTVVDGTLLTNTATVAAATTDPDPTDNTATTTTLINTRADLAITKSDAPDPAVAGAQVTYTLTVTNNGPSDAAAVTITDPLPASTTFASASPGCSNASGTVTCTAGTIAAGATTTRTIIVTVLPTVAAGTVISNTATVAATITDPTPADNTATAITTITTGADLSLTKTAPPSVAGTDVMFTINVLNNGPSDASDVTITDALEPALTFVGASPGCSEASGTVTCVLPQLLAGADVDVTITAAIDPGFTGPLPNTATVTAGTPDPNPADNTVTIDVPISAVADLAISKSVSPDPIVPGTNATYTIEVTNNGPSDTAALVTDALPAELSFSSAAGATCTASGSAVTCDLGTLDPGRTVAFTITVAVDPTATGTIDNNATVTGNAPDPDPANDTVTISTPSVPAVDLEITKTATSTHYEPGGPLTFEITVVNHGPSSAAGARVTDPLPPTLTDATWTCDANCTPSSGTGSVDTTVTLAPGAGSVITVAATVAPGTTGVVVNVASVEGGGSTQVAGAEVMPAGRISGHVFDDLNRNGRLDPGEPDLTGVLVHLTGAGPDGVLGTGDDVAGRVGHDVQSVRVREPCRGRVPCDRRYRHAAFRNGRDGRLRRWRRLAAPMSSSHPVSPLRAWTSDTPMHRSWDRADPICPLRAGSSECRSPSRRGRSSPVQPCCSGSGDGALASR